MSIVATLIGLVPSIISGVKEYVGKKQDLQKLRREAAVELEKTVLTAQIERARTSDIVDAELDKTSLENNGYQDDVLLWLTIWPMCLLMISPFVGGDILIAKVLAAFDALGKAPEYYWYALGAVYIHSLGMRRMFRTIFEKASGFTFIRK